MYKNDENIYFQFFARCAVYETFNNFCDFIIKLKCEERKGHVKKHCNKAKKLKLYVDMCGIYKHVRHN